MRILHVLLMAGLLLQGCGAEKEPAIAQRNRQQFTQLSIGMNGTQVIEVDGRPCKTEAYEIGQDTYSVLHYLTRRISDGTAADNETTPVLLKNDAVIGWGS